MYVLVSVQKYIAYMALEARLKVSSVNYQTQKQRCFSIKKNQYLFYVLPWRLVHLQALEGHKHPFPIYPAACHFNNQGEM